jgi:hypothetical protein
MVDEFFSNVPKPAPVIRAGSPVKVSNGPSLAPTRAEPNIGRLSAPTLPAAVSEISMRNRRLHAPKLGVENSLVVGTEG